MSDYWKETISEILSNHGFVFTTEKIESIAKDITSAANVEGEYTRIAEPVKPEINPLTSKVEKLERMLDALSAYYGVGFDVGRMEICTMIQISSSHSASHRIRID